MLNLSIMARPRPRIRVYWENPPSGALMVERGQTFKRLGPRGLLDLDEAAEALNRSRDEVVRAIRAGFLRARPRGQQLYVTVQACTEFLREEQADMAAQDLTMARIRTGRERVIPWKVVRRDS